MIEANTTQPAHRSLVAADVLVGGTCVLVILLPSQPRILCFSAANSSSVRMPSSRSLASSRNCAMGSSAGASGAGAGGGAAYCGCGSAYWGSSCAAQRFACRRETRLETEVAVPAMTAVRATPRSSPGISGWLPFSGGGGLGFHRLEGGEDALHGDAPAGDELPAGLADRDRDRGGPAVLP